MRVSMIPSQVYLKVFRYIFDTPYTSVFDVIKPLLQFHDFSHSGGCHGIGSCDECVSFVHYSFTITFAPS